MAEEAVKPISITRRTAKQRYSHRNPRVRRININNWQLERVAKFKASCKWAAAAKSARTALGVTQGEVDAYYGLCGGSCARWESGHYFGWNREELVEFTKVCAELGQQAK